jgi:hypothetical protein
MLRRHYKISKQIMSYLNGDTRKKVKSVLNGNTDVLFSLFGWSKSEQGHDYWEERFKNLVCLSPNDEEFLKLLSSLSTLDLLEYDVYLSENALNYLINR